MQTLQGMTAPETRTGLDLFVACFSSNPSTLKVYSLRQSDALMKAELMSCRAALLSAEHTHTEHILLMLQPRAGSMQVMALRSILGAKFYAVAAPKSHDNLSCVSLPEEVCSPTRQVGLKSEEKKQRRFAVWGENLSFNRITCLLSRLGILILIHFCLISFVTFIYVLAALPYALYSWLLITGETNLVLCKEHSINPV